MREPQTRKIMLDISFLNHQSKPFESNPKLWFQRFHPKRLRPCAKPRLPHRNQSCVSEALPEYPTDECRHLLQSFTTVPVFHVQYLGGYGWRHARPWEHSRTYGWMCTNTPDCFTTVRFFHVDYISERPRWAIRQTVATAPLLKLHGHYLSYCTIYYTYLPGRHHYNPLSRYGWLIINPRQDGTNQIRVITWCEPKRRHWDEG